MKLSEAIRLGSTMNPQARGSWKDMHGRTCAIGAAMDAIGKPAFSSYVSDAWPWMRDTSTCPSCWEKATVTGIILHLNDFHEWTRERIADWVETVEPKEDRIQKSLEALNAPSPTTLTVEEWKTVLEEA